MNHEPNNYLCPFCDWLAGNETDYKRNSDIVLQDNTITAFISPKWWINNPGHVIVIPNHHVENLYDIDDETLSRVGQATKHIASAICDGRTGTSTRQHNEARQHSQDVWPFQRRYFRAFRTIVYTKTIKTSIS